MKDYDYHEKKLAQTTTRNHAPRRHHKHYASMPVPNPQRHVVPTAVVPQSKLVPINVDRPITAAVPNIHGNPQHALKDKGVIDSGCSRHMTWNMSYLAYFDELNNGYVAFGGNPKGGKISGKGKIRTGKLDFDDVYFVKELKFNLFSVSQMCDKKNSDLFTEIECLVLSPEFKLPDENQCCLESLGKTICTMVLVTKPPNKTPYELLHGRTPSIGFMRPFGCLVTILNTLDSLGKFDGKEPEFKGRKLEAEVNVSPSSSAQSKKHDDKTKSEAKGKIPAVGQISTNITNTFSDDGPSNAAVIPTHGKSSYVDSSQLLDDRNMPELEGITYSDDKDNKVWVLVDLPHGKRAIGHTQEEGIDYEEVITPVARIEAIRLFLAYASFIGFIVYQMDVKSAFLYGTIEEDVYVCQPPGFEDLDYPDKIYVDGIIFGLTNKDFCKAFEKLMKDKFQISLMGELIFFLGLQVKQKKDRIFISQDKYVAEILRKFGLTEGKSASTPIDTEMPLLKDPDGVATSSTETEFVAAASCYVQVLWIQNQLLDYSDEKVRFKMDYFKGMTYDDIRPIFEKKFNSNVAFLLKTKEQMDEEDSRALKRLSESREDKAARKQKLDEEAAELKRHLQIVPNDEDDVYTEATPLARKVPDVGYKIYTENNKPYYKIKRADSSHQLYLSFLSMLRNFDREDLEVLWQLVKERFASTKPKNFSDDFLLMTLEALFEKPDVQAQIWKNQRSVHGQAKVKSWKLLESCGVQIITFTTTHLILLVERRYPLSRFTLNQLINTIRLEVEEESEVRKGYLMLQLLSRRLHGKIMYQPKKPRNSTWFKEMAMLTKTLATSVVLDEEHMEFLADIKDTVTTGQQSQDIPTLVAFQTNDLDAFYSVMFLWLSFPDMTQKFS
nr:copia protein [Tanacetum cinerariifolium]